MEILLGSVEIEGLLVAGMATEMCVTQTAIAGRELGYKVTVLAGACACVDDRLEQIALAYLADVVGVHIER
jgi:nicotinamidase-related amidase